MMFHKIIFALSYIKLLPTDFISVNEGTKVIRHDIDSVNPKILIVKIFLLTRIQFARRAVFTVSEQPTGCRLGTGTHLLSRTWHFESCFWPRCMSWYSGYRSHQSC